MPDAAYYRAWRAAHSVYRKRQPGLHRARRAVMTTEERQRDRGVYKPIPPAEPLALLLPMLQHGVEISFWEDELRLDLAQEARLAECEGRDPGAAVAAYRRREIAWRHHTCPFLLDGDND
jgi:hypothetical protein